MNGLEVRGLYKAFGSQSVLREADLDVAEGSLTAILGSSGSGKTTLLRMLAGFERPDGGVIRVGGRVVDDDRTHLAPQSRSVGFVPQEGALFPHLDVAANIGFGLPRRGRRGRVAELLELTDLGPLSGRYPHELSGGQQQRVALARSLAPQRGSCSSTNPSRRSTPRCGRRSATRWRPCWPVPGPPPCS
jgi:iron(III) transport system ATP-binding protein